MLIPPAEVFSADEPPRLSEDIDSTCSTPFVSAPSSPGHGPSGYFFSAPASPMHFLLSNQKGKNPSSYDYEPVFLSSDSGSFEFSARFSPSGSGGIGSMTSADELFFNGQIRPMKLSSHLERPQEAVVPFVDLYCEDPEEAATGRGRGPRVRNGQCSHRKARSMSPLRSNAEYEWQCLRTVAAEDQETEAKENESSETTPSCSASSSRSSSSGRNSKKWMFLKDLLNRSRSEGRADKKERLWSSISFSSTKDKKLKSSSSPALSPSSSRDEKKGKSETPKSRKTPRVARKPANAVWKRRVPPSAHELHYTTNRAQTEEMKKKTFLPYRQGLFGCLGFTSKSYGAFSGFTKNLNPISSR